jgi:uncharacterized OB-fold protein
LIRPDLDDEDVGPYWQGFQERELRVPMCEACGEVEWLPKHVCSSCGGTDLEWVSLSGEVRLHTWTVVRYDFQLEYLSDAVPICTGLVTPIEHDQVRLTAVIRLPESTEPEIGMALEIDFVESEDFDLLAPVYRPST